MCKCTEAGRNMITHSGNGQKPLCGWSPEKQESQLSSPPWGGSRGQGSAGSVREGCGHFSVSNGRPLQVSKLEWNKTKFALGRDHSNGSAENGLNGGRVD